jgi:hypothetical protein
MAPVPSSVTRFCVPLYRQRAPSAVTTSNWSAAASPRTVPFKGPPDPTAFRVFLDLFTPPFSHHARSRTQDLSDFHYQPGDRKTERPRVNQTDLRRGRPRTGRVGWEWSATGRRRVQEGRFGMMALSALPPELDTDDCPRHVMVGTVH